MNHALFKKLNFDPINVLVPIMLFERDPPLMLVRIDSPFKTLADIVEVAKAASENCQMHPAASVARIM
jgi:tripartite-type tricarboxylate transporter receptor subunit TctC